MKHLFLFVLIILGVSAFGQPQLTIFPNSWDLCYGANASFKALLVPDTNEYVFTWKKNGIVIPSPDTAGPLITIKNVTFADTGYYTCIAISAYDTARSDTAHLHLSPKLSIDTLYRYNTLGCPGTCKGQMKALVSGGNPPYSYDWGAGHSQDTIVYGLCKGTFMLKVVDSDLSHCAAKEYHVDVLRLPKVVFTMVPKDTVYLTKPYLTVAFADSSKKNLTNWEWDFGDSTKVANVNPLQHIYTRTGRFRVSLNYTDLDGCDTTITDSITVKPAELKFPNIISPNGDGHNDCFIIKEVNDPTYSLTLDDFYLSNELVIVNRWGRKVYSASNYHYKYSTVPGECQGWSGEGLADGAYYYVLKCHGLYEDDVFKGSITIIR